MQGLKKVRIKFFGLHQTQLACVNMFLMITNIFVAIAIIAKVANVTLQVQLSKNDTKIANSTHAKIMEARSMLVYFDSKEDHVSTFMLSIHAPNEHSLIGGGAIIAKYWALTTACCAEIMNRHPLHSVRIRGNVILHRHGFFHEPETIIINPRYDPDTLNYDVAVVKVKEPFVMENEVKIKLFPDEYYKNFNASEVTLLAWMKHNSSLQEWFLTADNSFGPEQSQYDLVLRNNTTGANFCYFYPGSIMVYTDVLLGAMSCRMDEKKCSCVYSNINFHKRWINSVVDE